MSNCAAINCESKIKNSGIIHHRFPSNPELLKYWLELCPLGYVLKDRSRLYAKHFDGNSIFLTPKNRGKRLLPTAKPIIDIQQDAQHNYDEFPPNRPNSPSNFLTDDIDIPTPNTAVQESSQDESPNHSHNSLELQVVDVSHEASDDQVHDKDSLSSTDDDMRFVDASMYSSDSENLPATTRTKRKLENEGSKGKKHSKTNIKLRVRTRRITEKEKLKYDILMLKKQLHRSKISKKKLKEKLSAVESLKIAAQNIVQGMEDMNPLAKMLFKNELFNGVKKPKPY